MRSCSVHVKKLVKVGLSEGRGVHLDFFFMGAGEGIMNVIAKTILW